MIRIFTIPFSPEHGTFFEDELNSFISDKKVKQIKAEFFQSGSKAYWTVFVEYEPILDESPPVDSSLSERDKLLYERLRQWRAERAKKDGIPTYIIATNRELLSIVNQKPRSKQALKEIKGFGRKKIAKYGEEILNIVEAFNK